MLYLFRPKFSEGAEELAYALSEAGTRARYIRKERPLVAGDQVICWGTRWPTPVPDTAGVQLLNNVAGQSKFSDAQVLRNANVATIEVSRTPQRTVPAVRPDFILDTNTTRWNEVDAQRVLQRLQAHLAAPLPQGVAWLPRVDNHIGGNDLLRTPARPDYWAKKEDITSEMRIHSFNGKSIRAGRKVQRPTRPDGAPSHPWIRSFDAGWVLAYEDFSSPQPARDLAARAVEALGLQFGAVDLATRADGSLMVLEVNRAPGIEGGSIQAYVKAIQSWLTPAARARRAA